MRALDKRYRRILATLFLGGLALPLGVYAWGAFVIVRVPSLVEFNPDRTVHKVYYELVPWTLVWNADTLPKDVRAETVLPDGTRVVGAARYNPLSVNVIEVGYATQLARRWGSRYTAYSMSVSVDDGPGVPPGGWWIAQSTIHVKYEPLPAKAREGAALVKKF